MLGLGDALVELDGDKLADADLDAEELGELLSE
jgi:hypothetical protein